MEEIKKKTFVEAAKKGIYFINAGFDVKKEKMLEHYSNAPDKDMYKKEEFKRVLTNETLSSLSFKVKDGYSYLSLTGTNCKVYCQDDFLIVETIYDDIDRGKISNIIIYLKA